MPTEKNHSDPWPRPFVLIPTKFTQMYFLELLQEDKLYSLTVKGKTKHIGPTSRHKKIKEEITVHDAKQHQWI